MSLKAHLSIIKRHLDYVTYRHYVTSVRQGYFIEQFVQEEQEKARKEREAELVLAQLMMFANLSHGKPRLR